VVPAVGECFIAPDFQGEGCPVPEIPSADVPRIELAETNGPGEATMLSVGDYVGHLGGPLGRFGTDIHDWYRLRTHPGEALVFWLATDPGLEVDVIFLDDPCGHELFRYEGAEGLLQCIAPCTGDKDYCGWFVRIIRRSGEGNYYISILPAIPAP
jgi:hypothetical protein